MKKLNKGGASIWGRIFRALVLALPLSLYFSYFPVISLGANGSMNFELSIPLIWLVVFDVVGGIYAFYRKVLFVKIGRKWMWLLFPVWLSLSVLWSPNMTRGVLTVGILWLIYFACYLMWRLRDEFGGDFRERFLKWFFGATIFVCTWCVIQCILDLVNVSRDYSLMCAGCTYKMFGFPHPNGFAIEPQFMGNLLLAPMIVVGWQIFRSWPRPAGPSPRAAGANSRAAALRNAISLKYFAILFVLVVTLFLTFSRGAIYAAIVGLCFMSGFKIFSKKKERKNAVKQVGVVWGIVILSFVVALNIQGVMAAVSPTNDTYVTGVTKVLNHLSLGVIDIRGEKPMESDVVVENPVENSVDKGNEAVFDGYVAESTDTRVKLSGVAMKTWARDFPTMLFGVGIGGAGQAIYDNGLSPSPKEIVQNEYPAILLETGLVGFILFVLAVLLLIKFVLKSSAKMMALSLLVAYGVSLVFFSGLPNALQIYLLPMLFTVIFYKSIDLRKKLVS
ncbi:O-antigen ligase family protein [Candidatus Saccharibacteria bacterium]|nr:O-antigen ligase family protein [Candidatus Saccharibacteria bacterium]